jgi:hypothetical protein
MSDKKNVMVQRRMEWGSNFFGVLIAYGNKVDHFLFLKRVCMVLTFSYSKRWTTLNRFRRIF